MNYNINDILPFVKNYNFPEYFSCHEEDFLISSIEEEDYDWNEGASKLVIVPEKLDYVIKIPFNARKSELDGEYYDMSQDYCNTEMELYLQIKEENPVFANFFLPLTWVKEFYAYDIYLQSKCIIYRDTNAIRRRSFYSKDSLKAVKDSKITLFSKLPDDWMASVIERLGTIEATEEFLEVLDKYDISQDLHQGNIGYRNGMPVILDYGSYYD